MLCRYSELKRTGLVWAFCGSYWITIVDRGNSAVISFSSGSKMKMEPTSDESEENVEADLPFGSNIDIDVICVLL